MKFSSSDTIRALITIFLFTFGFSLPGGLCGADWFAYVTNGSSADVSFFNVMTNTANPTVIPLPPSSSAPFGIAITPDATRAYVVNANTNNVSVIDLLTNTANPINIDLPVGSNAPISIAITPDGTLGYVLNQASFDVSVIDLLTNTALSNIALPDGFTLPSSIAITPDGTQAFVVKNFTTNVSVIDLLTNTVSSPVILPVGSSFPSAIAITPDGTRAYVVNTSSNDISVIDLPSNTVNQPNIPLPIGADGPFAIAITPDGTRAYVLNNQTSNTVSIVDLLTNTSTLNITLDASITGLFSIAITPDGASAYVIGAFPTSTAVRIDLTTDTLDPSEILLPGNGPSFGIAITPDQAPIASFTFTTEAEGTMATFDASASTTLVGTITSYAWDFGDGQSVTTTTPFITHVYAVGGSYSAKLTVTNSGGTSTAQVFTGQTMSRNGGPSAATMQDISFVVMPFPPQHLRGHQIKNKFLTQTDLANILTWRAPLEGPTPVKYLIYRDSVLTMLIGTVNSTKELTFVDHNRKKNCNYSYFIVSVDASGALSVPAHLIVSPAN